MNEWIDLFPSMTPSLVGLVGHMDQIYFKHPIAQLLTKKRTHWPYARTKEVLCSSVEELHLYY